MAGVLIRLKVATLRHAWRGGQSSMLWSGAALGALLAVATVGAVTSTAGLGAAFNTAAVAFGVWALIWMMLPLIGGSGGDPLRPEIFRLLAIPPRRLAIGLLAAGAVGVTPAVSVLAFASLVAVGARLGPVPVVVSVVAVVLMIALVIALSRVVVGAMGRAMETRLGLELAAIQYAIVIALSMFWLPLSVISAEAGSAPGAGGFGRVLVDVARILPTGWGVLAVEAAGTSNWPAMVAAIGGQLAVIGLLAWAWAGLVARRLELSPGSRSGPGRSLPRLPAAVREIVPASPFGAVITRELRTWLRHPRRGLELRVAVWSAVLLAIAPALLGSTLLWPWAGAIIVVIAGNGLANVFGMDGTSFWLTLMTPGSERIEVRGRQAAWLLVVGSVGIGTAVVLTAISGHPEAWPWVAASLPALLGGAAGLGILLSVVTPAALPERRGGDPLDLGDDPTTGGNLMLHGVVMSLAVPALAIPAVVAAAASPILGLVAGLATGGVYAWLGGSLAIWRLRRAGPETLERLRSRPAPRPSAATRATEAPSSRWRSVGRNVLLLAGALLVFPQGLAALGLKLSGSESRVWFAALYLPEPWPVAAAIAAIVLGLGAWYLAWRISRPAPRHGLPDASRARSGRHGTGSQRSGVDGASRD